MLYVAPISDIIDSYSLKNMFYADDSKLYVSLNSDSNDNCAFACLETCITVIKGWMKTNMRKVNDGKTEVILLCHQHSWETYRDRSCDRRRSHRLRRCRRRRRRPIFRLK